MKTSVFKILTAISFGSAFTYVTLGHYYQAGAMIALTGISFLCHRIFNR
jgi:hypothetical protein